MPGDPTRFRVIKGERHKLCSGPAHDEPTWLPATEKYYYRRSSTTDRLHSQCRLCHAWRHVKSPGESGYVPINRVMPFFIEAIRRVGKAETARRVGIAETTLSMIVNGNRQYVQKRTLRRLMLEVISMRRKGEAWHRDSIRRGAKMRGEEVKLPVRRNDYYHMTGDNDNENRRLWNREHPEAAAEDNRKRVERHRRAHKGSATM